jgi:F0F1-type ATP synthase alpha subunit
VRLREHIGAVLGVMDSIATIVGLYRVGFSEMVIFRPWVDKEVGGMIINLEREYASVLVFEREDYIDRGYLVYRGFKVMSVPVGCSLLGFVLTAVGNVLNISSALSGFRYREQHYTWEARVEVSVPGFIDREPVRMSLITG